MHLCYLKYSIIFIIFVHIIISDIKNYLCRCLLIKIDRVLSIIHRRLLAKTMSVFLLELRSSFFNCEKNSPHRQGQWLMIHVAVHLRRYTRIILYSNISSNERRRRRRLWRRRRPYIIIIINLQSMADVKVSIRERSHQSHTCSHRCFFVVSSSFYVIPYTRQHGIIILYSYIYYYYVYRVTEM